MKKYDRLIFLSIVLYLVLAAGAGGLLRKQKRENSQLYKVEINRLLADIQTEDDLINLDLSKYREVEAVSYLPVSKTDRQIISDFYQGTNGRMYMVFPLYGESKGQEVLSGYLRFDYKKADDTAGVLLLVEIVLLLMELSVLAVLYYFRHHLIGPFERMQDMAYELSKGNLQGEMKTEKSQLFGKFVWGMNALKDELQVSRNRELQLQKEKKLLLLSLSHDIKTPLHMITLYTRALADGIYSTGEEQAIVYKQIEDKTAQIETFVSEIMKASTEDILHIEVKKGEFYFRELVQWIQTVYGEKCQLRKCQLAIEEYQDRIFSGDINRLMEMFGNIFENAFKYGDGRRIEISFYEEDYCQLVRVFNTGSPVSEKEFVHLFDSFFRGENTRGQQGNGLGLYICREIMHKMDGEIFAECETDGMAFTVVLPLQM